MSIIEKYTAHYIPNGIPVYNGGPVFTAIIAIVSEPVTPGVQSATQLATQSATQSNASWQPSNKGTGPRVNCGQCWGSNTAPHLERTTFIRPWLTD